MKHEEAAIRADLTALKDAVINRAFTAKNPVLYFSKAMGRLLFLGDRAAISGDWDAEVLKFADEFGLLDRTVH